jgi:TrmH family RNA methyltransferase
LLAVFQVRDLNLPPELDFILAVDAIRDPGNLGTLLRSAAAAGVQAVLLGPGTVDVFSPKVLRAGMGAQFRLPIREMDWEQIRLMGKDPKKPLRIFLAETENGTPLWQANFRQPAVIIVGGEAEGAGESARRLADEWVAIPMPGKSESLNAAVAASILLFEVVRQRSE